MVYNPFLHDRIVVCNLGKDLMAEVDSDFDRDLIGMICGTFDEDRMVGILPRIKHVLYNVLESIFDAIWAKILGFLSSI